MGLALDGEPHRFPFERAAPFDPPLEYLEALQTEGLTQVHMWDGSPAWLVTRVEDVQQLLSSDSFSAEPIRPGYPFVSETLRSLLVNEEPNLALMDGADHLRLRRMLAPLLTKRRIELLRPRIQQMVDDALDDLKRAQPPVELYESFALVVPSMAIAELLGIPYEDHEIFQDAANARMDLTVSLQAPLEAGERMSAYLAGVIERRMADGTEGADDTIGRLIVDQIRPGKLTIREAAAMLRLVVIAGHETTAATITFGMLVLFRNPDQLQRLQADPLLIPDAVEEILRYTTPPHFNSMRVAIEDVEIGGHLIRAGEGVLAMLSAANRDPRSFSDPNTFDISRTRNDHLTFAHGIHSCLGQALARLELQTAFTALLTRLPGLRLVTPFESLTYRDLKRAYGVDRLEVTWDESEV